MRIVSEKINGFCFDIDGFKVTLETDQVRVTFKLNPWSMDGIKKQLHITEFHEKNFKRLTKAFSYSQILTVFKYAQQEGIFLMKTYKKTKNY